MPPRAALSTPLRAWRCPQCRAFATSPRQRALGPEHPRFIEVPEPPQQTAPYLPFIKGRLPVPRDVVSGRKGKDRAGDEEIAKAAPEPKSQFRHPEGSRLEWKQKLSESRRQNLREGLKALRARTNTANRRRTEQTAQRQAEREELLHRPEREDERLTAPSHGLDLAKLMHGPPPDPNRRERLKLKAQNFDRVESIKSAQRQDALHSLYMQARSFIVTPEQLDKAVDEAFGSADKPVSFNSGTSMWNYGKPDSLQDMLNRANQTGGRGALESAGNRSSGVQSERMRRLAEALTGGKMDEHARD